MKEEFRRAFGESTEEVVEQQRPGEVGEEALRSRAGKTAVPSEMEVEEHKSGIVWTREESVE